MKPKVAATIVLALAGFGIIGAVTDSHDDPTPAATTATHPPTPTGRPASRPPATPEPSIDAMTWARGDGYLNHTSWWGLVKTATLNDNTLTITTRIYPDNDGKTAADILCSGWSTITQTHPHITTILVKSSTGTTITHC